MYNGDASRCSHDLQPVAVWLAVVVTGAVGEVGAVGVTGAFGAVADGAVHSECDRQE